MEKISKKKAVLATCSIALSLLILMTLFFKLNVPSKGKAQIISPNDRQINSEADDNIQKMILNVEKLIGKKMNEAIMPGLSVAIVKDNKTIYMSGFGYANINSRKKATSDTLYQIGSNSKAFTALGVLQLQKDGFIDFNDEITKYIPWLKFYYEGNEASVTIEEFLHHTSGISSCTIDRIPELSEENKDAIEKTVRIIVDLQLVSKPGEKYEYATLNYDVLGLLIKYVSGMNYEDYIQKYVLDTAGLYNTYMYRSQLDINKMSAGYKVGFFSPQRYEAPIYEGNKPAGYIISNANDMAEWLKIQMGTSSTSLLSNELIQESHVPNLNVETFGKDMAYAAGWIVYNNNGTEIFHSGSNPNYSSYVVFRPKEKIGVAVLCNTKSYCTTEIGQAIMDMFTQNQNQYTNIVDLNQSIDRVCVIIIFTALIILCFIIYPFLRSVCGLVRKKYKLQLRKKKNIMQLVILSIFFVLLNCIIFYLPYFLFNKLTWNYIFIWYPVTVKFALCSICICIWLLYFTFALKFALKETE